MDNYTIEITKPAETDLAEIGRYINEDLLEPVIAMKTVDRISE